MNATRLTEESSAIDAGHRLDRISCCSEVSLTPASDRLETTQKLGRRLSRNQFVCVHGCNLRQNTD